MHYLGVVRPVGGQCLKHALRLGDQRREVTEERGVRRGADHLTAWPSMAKRTRHGQAEADLRDVLLPPAYLPPISRLSPAHLPSPS